ncbi:hypothetical protein [Amycolatopsis anabasis]|uniref:hypothetical protein n=1 Tax=Amycolatopsis anabasis TaxID=1840409 RepID=UPI0015D15B70|nr:hypothetical protein [Amycolatopsis anabasis]
MLSRFLGRRPGRRVPCRDHRGWTARIHIRRVADAVEVEFPHGGTARLTALQVGRFRAALRDAVLEDPPRAESASTEESEFRLDHHREDRPRCAG